MRRIVRIVLSGLLLIAALGLGLVVIGLHQLSDPASAASSRLTAVFVDRCVAMSRRADHAQPVDVGGAGDNLDDPCRCGADDLREDLADTGIGGLAHMIFVEGIDAKLQRVMDACQASPSAP